jgi:hypothetical protein
MNHDEKIKSVYMPILIVILTAFLGSAVGAFLQNRSFRHNARFQAQLNLLVTGRQEAIRIREDVDEALRQIRSNESLARRQMTMVEVRSDSSARQLAEGYYCAPEYLAPYTTVLKESRVKIASIREDTVGLRKPSLINTAIEQYVKTLGGFIECLDSPGCNYCSKTHGGVVQPLDDVISGHTRAANALATGQ